MADSKWKWTSCETQLRYAEDKIAELEAVILVAHDALEFDFQLFSAILDQGENNGYVITHPEWIIHARDKSEVAMAATKHRRI